jgi:predicted acylesterase/phospholipase RssA
LNAGAGEARTAVILSGGGAYGAYEIGVMQALFEGRSPATHFTPLDAHIFTGTSVGAVNAAVMCSQPGVPSYTTVERLKSLWLERIASGPDRCGNGVFRFRGDPTRYLDPQCLAENPLGPLVELTEDGAVFAQELIMRGVNFFRSPGSLQTRSLEFIDLSAFISSEPLQKLIREAVSTESIRRSDKTLRIVATNWETGEVKIFENKDVTDEVGHDVILSSTSIPGFFPPQYINGDPYVDGGVVMNTPLKCAIQAGAEVLHVIYLDPDVRNLPLKVLQNTYNTLDRTLLINNATVTSEDVVTASWINDGLDAVERVGRGETPTDPQLLAFVRTAAVIEQRLRSGAPYKKLTIHRYHPKRDPGGGGVGILNFDRDRMRGLIELGFEDTTAHNCVQSKCVLPNHPHGN